MVCKRDLLLENAALKTEIEILMDSEVRLLQENHALRLEIAEKDRQEKPQRTTHQKNQASMRRWPLEA